MLTTVLPVIFIAIYCVVMRIVEQNTAKKQHNLNIIKFRTCSVHYAKKNYMNALNLACIFIVNLATEFTFI